MPVYLSAVYICVILRACVRVSTCSAHCTFSYAVMYDKIPVRVETTFVLK